MLRQHNKCGLQCRTVSGITWWWALDDDTIVVAWLLWKHRGDTSPWVCKHCFRGQIQLAEIDDVARIPLNRRLPQSELVRGDVVKLGRLLFLDGFLELIDRICEGDLNRECIRSAIDQTKGLEVDLGNWIVC